MLPRYKMAKTNLQGKPIYFIDSASFVFMYDEIFKKEIYKFTPSSLKPRIIDCGANIGLSVIYFKKNFPGCRITAFEPDELAYSVLERNVENFCFKNVELVKKAVWVSDEYLEFMSEGADGGRVVETSSESFEKYKVKAERLRNHLEEPVDFLKIDIEGAETEVVQDCKDLLHNVGNLFIEYHSFVNRPQTIHTLTAILFEAGFRVHIHPPVMSPHPFLERIAYMGMDMQLNIFAFRDNYEVP